MKRTMAIMLFGVLLLGGCGMDRTENNPVAEAQQAPLSDLLAAVTAPVADGAGQALVVDGRLWVPAGLAITLREERMRPVGSASGLTVHARSWDQPPYDELFVRLEPGARDDPLSLEGDADQWQGYLPVIGGGAPAGSTPPSAGGHGEAPGH